VEVWDYGRIKKTWKRGRKIKEENEEKER